jgi:hypothetical protein
MSRDNELKMTGYTDGSGNYRSFSPQRIVIDHQRLMEKAKSSPPNLFLLNVVALSINPIEVDHAILLDIKDTLKLHGDIGRTGKEVDDCMVYHFTGDGLQFCTLRDYCNDYYDNKNTHPVFSVDGICSDTSAARERLLKYAETSYSTLSSNCEHFAYDVLTGKKRSPQLFAALMGAAPVAVAGLFALRDDGNR